MLRLYALFHLNLMYSSIEEENRPEVVRRCYWPLLELVASGFEVAIEVSGVTLELIRDLDPRWVDRLRELVRGGQVEFIGSGYAQIIGPLVPARVNHWNQQIGLEVYQELLGVRPHMALVNEMAYSAGIVEHYAQSGYEAIMMEWNNPRKYHPEWSNEWRYYPQRVKGADGVSLPILWADSIAFQKFQRFAHGEYGLDDYMAYLRQHVSSETRYFPLYANDAEIFDFRPGRYETEKGLSSGRREWERIDRLFGTVASDPNLELVFPHQVLDGLIHSMGGHELALESPEQPIPVKKQEKYNINRWALTGRDDLGINTACYKLFRDLIRRDARPAEFKELCYFWSSDFRTHITRKRWEKYLVRFQALYGNYQNQQPEREMEQTHYPPRYRNCGRTESHDFVTIETDGLTVILNKFKGLTIAKCIFRDLGDIPLFGTLRHGYYDDLSLAADFYSGHGIVEYPGSHKITDLDGARWEVHENKNSPWLKVNVDHGAFRFSQVISLVDSRLMLTKLIELPRRRYGTIRPMHFTFNPEAWDQSTLYVKTHNGGSEPEIFRVGPSEVDHSGIYSPLISARHALGATEGQLAVGDKYKELRFQHDATFSALIPSFIFRRVDDGNFFLRLQYSAQETDETFVGSETDFHVRCKWEVSLS